MGHKDVSLEDLLAPQPFARGNYSAHLYAPFSLKLHRRVYLYAHDGYDLWVHLESACDVAQFNERVMPVPLALGNGRASVLAPAAVSSHCDGTMVVHTFDYSVDINEDTQNLKSEAWERWCDLHGFLHQEWSAAQLQANPTKLANLKRLLRFASYAGYIRNVGLEKSLMDELRNVRKTTFAKLIQQFPQSDPDEVQQSLARIILDQEIYSDIHLSPLSMITEVSAYHESPPEPT